MRIKSSVPDVDTAWIICRTTFSLLDEKLDNVAEKSGTTGQLEIFEKGRLEAGEGGPSGRKKWKVEKEETRE